MEHLLYSSKEMFSSTELLRKSKTIFDKISQKKIKKAVILRDGKPSFILMDFEKYETIMHEYEKMIKQQNKYIAIEDIEITPKEQTTNSNVASKEFW